MSVATCWKKEKRNQHTHEITPMIDVVFQILIFFLITIQIKSVEEHLYIYLPRDGRRERTPPIVPPEPVLVLIQDDPLAKLATNPMVKYSRGCTYYINSKDGVGYRNPNQLREALRPLMNHPDTELLVLPVNERHARDQETPWKNVMGAVDAAIQARFKRIRFRPHRRYW